MEWSIDVKLDYTEAQAAGAEANGLAYRHASVKVN
jgi:hypothetical protein